jgi:hypothetical protein
MSFFMGFRSHDKASSLDNVNQSQSVRRVFPSAMLALESG